MKPRVLLPFITGLFVFKVTALFAADSTPASKFDSFRIAAKEPSQAESTFQCVDGFQMKLIAAEPLTTDPTAIVYDENGVAYVAEMNDYPFTDKKNDIAWKESIDPPGGRVRVLIDEDGDGKFDKSFIFAEEMSWPTGLACWKGGVFVAAAPDIWYLKDTNGDHKADVRIKVYTGFRKYNVQAVMNNLVWGLDHKIYGAASGNGGTVQTLSAPNDKPVALTRNDFRFDAETKQFEALSGGARFGNTFDDFGNRFICNIRNPVQQVVLPSHYLARNPYLLVHSAIIDCARASDDLPVYRISQPEPWRVVRAKQWLAETTHKYPRSETAAEGFFTSTSGITIYRGAAYPAKYYGSAFMGEVAGNLVHRQVLTPNGVVFSAERGDPKTEFVRSTDNWFRPVNYINAPDGTLHVLDMYRETIEHPWSIPDEIKAQVDLTSGKDRGRIYRLEPPNFKVPKPPRLGKANTKELVATLENPNSWWRDTAHRLIFERQDKSAIKPLQQLLRKSKSPLARLHALYSLDGLKALTDADITVGLSDDTAGVRENAVRLAESRLKNAPALVEKVLALADDSAIRVRFQTAFTLGELQDSRTGPALLKIAQRDSADTWMQTAVLSSVGASSMPMLSGIIADKNFSRTTNGQEMVKQLSFMIGARPNDAEVGPALALASAPSTPSAVRIIMFAGMADGLKRAGKSITKIVSDPASPAGQTIGAMFHVAQEVALMKDGILSQRQEAIQMLGYNDFPKVEKTLTALLDARQPQELQMAAVHALSSFTSPKVAGILVAQWRNFTPMIRNEALEALVARKERLPVLLEAVEKQTIAAAQIPAARKTMMMSHKDVAISNRANALFGKDAPSARKDVVAQYQSALKLNGERTHGEKVFEVNCSVCHRVGDKGNEVGPNLATVRAWSPDQLMLTILDPNREVSPNYVNYNVDLKNGESVTGLIAEETATSITLKRANNVQETILRQNIDKISSSGLS
ncbi:MAG: Cytochrome c, partial [Verrucomicrobiales bacterium]|nr:Cytochrome c [Verrucomicrobiales bacterium]